LLRRSRVTQFLKDPQLRPKRGKCPLKEWNAISFSTSGHRVALGKRERRVIANQMSREKSVEAMHRNAHSYREGKKVIRRCGGRYVGVKT